MQARPNLIWKVKKEHSCAPGFYSATEAQRKEFWIAVVASIARWESGFDPNAFNPNDPGGGSLGLMQLSYPDVYNSQYLPCAINAEQKNIFDPKVNLQCGVSILRHQIQTRRKIFHGLNERFYWRVLEIYGDGAIFPYSLVSFLRIRAQMPFCYL